MQILQWLFKTAIPESPKTASSNSTSTSPKLKHRDGGEKETKVAAMGGGGRRRRVEKSTKLSCDDMILLRFIQRRDISKSFFYHTLNLRSRTSDKTTMRRRRSEEMGGNKVLPVARSSARNSAVHQLMDSDERIRKKKGCGKKGVSSRVKELIKWSATTKVTNFKKRSSSKATRDDDEVKESPKISIEWEMEGCSITKIISTISKDDRMQCSDNSNSECATGTGNWITTDSEFVVLEL